MADKKPTGEATSDDPSGSIAATAYKMAHHLKSHLPAGNGDERITAWLDLVADCRSALSGDRTPTGR